jgi:hypothetical protein
MSTPETERILAAAEAAAVAEEKLRAALRAGIHDAQKTARASGPSVEPSVEQSVDLILALLRDTKPDGPGMLGLVDISKDGTHVRAQLGDMPVVIERIQGGDANITLGAGFEVRWRR